ncbi:MAG: hypothetical protein ABIZ72_01530, partial [Candidatus Limnocylindrales bacterium]
MPTLDATIRRRLMVGALVASLILILAPASALGRGAIAETASRAGSADVTPIVLFPAWHFTRLTVTVKNQRTDPACSSSGTFEDLAFEDPGPAFSQVCRDELLTLRYSGRAHQPIRLRFSEQPGVTVSVAD